jgi:hypothetical protein
MLNIGAAKSCLASTHAAQRGIKAGFQCITGRAFAMQQRSAILVNPPPGSCSILQKRGQFIVWFLKES